MHKITVFGVVQGVGFRPYIYRKAKEYGLVGYVKNIGHGVEILVNDAKFAEKLTDLPPLAKITGSETIETAETQKQYPDFIILKSEEGKNSETETQLPPDIFTCPDCLTELRDKHNRRHDYYFVTCTNCGPRFSMIENYPYDRPLTSMKDFQMCPQCKKEYTDPLNRRYHAQTIACKDCGPKLSLRSFGKNISESNRNDRETIIQAAKLLKSGNAVSIKGVGGFHLCSIAEESAVGNVRRILNRPHKPFALMVRDLEMLKDIAFVSETEKKLLESPERPIVVLKKKDKSAFRTVSELDSLGIMLPYTSLHYLLFDFIDEPIVMTSCNVPGEPVSIAVDEKMADHFLTHERKIVNRCDDSVIKVIGDQPFFLRRSRGYTPLPISLPVHTKDTLALGAELSNVICVTKKDKAFLSQYIGETSKLETFNFMKEAVEKMLLLTRAKPSIIACDLHPSYNSTLLAKSLSAVHNAKLVQIQHHKAHVAGAAAEHNLKDYVGIAMDGLGFGEDSNIWGGEVFDVENANSFRRIGSLEEQPQLGGDSATVNPKKMLFGILASSGILEEKDLLHSKLFDEHESKVYMNMLNDRFNTPLTTSTGRILDAAAAFLGLCDKRTYDGRPAMVLESAATTPLKLEPVLKRKDGRTILSTSDLFRFLEENKDSDKGRLAATVQTYLASGLYEIAREAAEKDGKRIVFSGGVAYNQMISSYMISRKILLNRKIPAGDGGLCYGQAVLANLH